MKISSSHHRFGLWWLCYLCLCCLQNIFWPLVEILPFLWICRCLPLVYCVRGVAVTIGLGCITPLHVASRLPFCLGLRFFLSCESVVDYFSSTVWEEWQLPLFMLPSGYLFAFGGDLSFFVNLPLLISCLLCRRSSNGHYQVWVCRPEEMMNSSFLRICFRGFASGLLISSVFYF